MFEPERGIEASTDESSDYEDKDKFSMPWVKVIRESEKLIIGANVEIVVLKSEK